jgi:hypothetical protein
MGGGAKGGGPDLAGLMAQPGMADMASKFLAQPGGA